MCLICVEFQKEKLSIHEAYRNLGEMKTSIGEDHYKEVLDMIEEAEWKPKVNLNLLSMLEAEWFPSAEYAYTGDLFDIMEYSEND